MFNPDDRPEIEFPCTWTFKVIGQDEEVMRGAVRDCLDAGPDAEAGNREFSLDYSRASGSGTYVSLRLELIVHSRDERDELFRQLTSHPEIRFVI